MTETLIIATLSLLGTLITAGLSWHASRRFKRDELRIKDTDERISFLKAQVEIHQRTVDTLQKKVTDLEARIAKCEEVRKQLIEEKIVLLERLAGKDQQ